MSEVTLSCKLARNYTMAGLTDSLAYLLIKLIPNTLTDFGSMPLNIGLILDISGSMRGQKIKNAKLAAKHVINSLKPVDTISVTIFSDEARAIIPVTKVTDKYSIIDKVDKISIVGGTRMYHGLETSAREMHKVLSNSGINRMIVLTDGETEGEEQCTTIARQEAHNNISLTTFGIGNEYNEDFLKEISDITLGSFYHLQTPDQIGSEFIREINNISAGVISNVRLSINLVNDVTLEELYRIYPDITRLYPEVEAEGNIFTIPVGNIRKDEQTIFGAQFKLPARQAGRVRIAQIFASFNIPSLLLEDKVEKQNVILEYTENSELCGIADKEVITYFTQLNAQSLIDKAIRETREGNFHGATEALNQAQLFTQRIGNIPLTRSIEAAMQELKEKGTITPGLIKTVRAGSGHTVRIDEEDS